jgi:hypothetical protein
MHATGGSSSGGSGSAMDDLLGQLRGGVGSSQGGGTIFDSLKKIFSTGEGGLFAPKKNLLTGEDSKLGGIMSGAGGLMGILGGLIGGNAGGVLSSVGTFMSLGANFGPIGAGVGAAVGLIVGLFGISSKRKKEEQTRNAGLLDAEAAVRSAFDSAKQDLQFGRTDGPGALSSFSSSTSQIMGQYMQMANSLTDKKTRSHAIQDASRVQGLIATKTDELKALAAMAEANAERSKRIIPEFAGGHYFADYFRPNGLLPGMFDGRDDLLAMISRGEMVLNPQQQNRVRQLAGHDVFAGAGIPNYPRSNPSAKLAMGGIASGSLALAGAPNIVVQPRFTLELSGVSLDDKVEAYLTSDTGIRTQIQVNKTLKKRGDI